MKKQHGPFLSTGERISIRPIRRRDADARHQLYLALSFGQTGMVHCPAEVELHSQESIDHINHFLQMRSGLWLIAENENEDIIGEIDITVKNLKRIRHVGKLTIGVKPDYQKKGLGSLLMREALSWAEQAQLKRIELFVFASNSGARALYKKFGFVEEGQRKNFLCHDDGSFEDDFLMAKYL
jgi:RimJ/RimL family protein N-acetyltransferase